MNVRTLCLAILYFNESSGYDIRKHVTEGAYSHFVEASYGSIYPALAKLEADGLVTSREESHPGRPARKVYRITEDGRAAFRSALASPLQPDVFRSPFLLTALCAELMDPRDMESAVEDQLRNMLADLATVEKAADESAMRGADWVHRLVRHTIGASIAFIEENRDQLIQVSRDGADEATFDTPDVLEAAE